MQLDLIALGEPLLEFNQLTFGERVVYLAGHGGDTSNCAIAAARQGARVGYLTAVGTDPFGDSFLDLWRREGLDIALVRRDPEAHTGIYFVSHGPEGHSFTYFRTGSAASRMRPRDLDPDYIGSARFLHVSAISQAISDSACDTAFHAIDLARQLGVRVSYDTNLRLKLWPLDRARAIIHATVDLSDLVFCSMVDAAQLTGLETAEAIADYYLGRGVRLLALELGAEGALIATPERRFRVEGHRVATVDATGAGDTFAGAFLARLAAGDDIPAAARYANAAAALSTTGHGAVAPIPHRTAVLQFLGGV